MSFASILQFPENKDNFAPLAPWTYKDADVLSLEYENIFRKNWQLVCHQNDVKNLGDYFTFEIMNDSILIMRDKEEEIHAFLNVCRHRASKLLTGKGNCKSRIQCPYHGWSYDLNGDLKAVARDKSFPDLDKKDFGLFELRMEVFQGFVYVLLDNSAEVPSLIDQWGPFTDDIEPYRLSEIESIGEIEEEIWDVNWKVAWDNYLESYHVPVGHPTLARILKPGQILSMLDSGIAREIFEIQTKESKVPYERTYQQLVREENKHLPESLRDKWQQYSLYPNLGLDYYAEMMDFFQVIPINENQSRIRAGMYALPDSNKNMERLREINIKMGTITNDEDRDLCTRVQSGLNNTTYLPGPLAKEEIGIRQFHEMVMEAVPVTKLSGKPTNQSISETNRKMQNAV